MYYFQGCPLPTTHATLAVCLPVAECGSGERPVSWEEGHWNDHVEESYCILKMSEDHPGLLGEQEINFYCFEHHMFGSIYYSN